MRSQDIQTALYPSGFLNWLSKDPIGISGGLNLYVFCGNNPFNFIDPSGLSKAKVVESGAYRFVQYAGDTMHGGAHIHVYSRRGGALLGRVTPGGKVLTGSVPKSALKKLVAGAVFSAVLLALEPAALGDSTLPPVTPESMWMSRAYQAFDQLYPDFARNEQGGRTWTSDLIEEQNAWVNNWLMNNPMPEGYGNESCSDK